jgi:hypothetical protein
VGGCGRNDLIAAGLTSTSEVPKIDLTVGSIDVRSSSPHPVWELPAGVDLDPM